MVHVHEMIISRNGSSQEGQLAVWPTDLLHNAGMYNYIININITEGMYSVCPKSRC